MPRVSQAPGFVAAFWVRIAEDQGTGVIVFESEDAARTMADQMPRQTPGDVTTVDSIEVGEVVEHA